MCDEYADVMLIELMLIELMQSEGKFEKGGFCTYRCEGASGSQKPKKPKMILEVSQKFLAVSGCHFLTLLGRVSGVLNTPNEELIENEEHKKKKNVITKL
jgi:hypothetical protein